VRRLALLIGIAGSVLVLACGGDGDENTTPPTAQEQATFCRDVEAAQDSLADVRDSLPSALIPANQAEFQSTVQTARADLNSLDSSARELEGGSDQVADLRQSIQDFQRLLATPDLIPVIPQLRDQAQVIQEDLRELRATGGCPN
jgi:hypothetical protein